MPATQVGTVHSTISPQPGHSVGFGVSPAMLDGPSCFYRVHGPAQLLSGQHRTAVIVGCHAATPDRQAPIGLLPLGGREPLFPDALVFHYATIVSRPADTVTDNEIGFIVRRLEWARASGQKVFMDLDDDIWAVPDYNSFADKVREDARRAPEIMRAMTAVLCSTPTLAAVCAEETGAETIYAPNIYQPERWQPRDVVRRQEETGTVIVGWHGLCRTSGADVQRIGRLMAPVLESHPEVMFRHVGAERYGDFADMSGLDPQRVSSHPGVPIITLPQALDFDIGLVVREEGRFNRSRTNTKGFELAAGGVPVIAVTDMQPYQDTLFLCDEADFAERVEQLLDADTRQAAGEQAHTWAQATAAEHRALWPVDALKRSPIHAA